MLVLHQTFELLRFFEDQPALEANLSLEIRRMQ